MVQFLTLDLLVAAVEMNFLKGGTVSNAQKGQKVVQELTLRYMTHTYTHTCITWVFLMGDHYGSVFLGLEFSR